MSVKHPIVAITGSSGAGTTTVMSSFKHIFRRDGIKAQVLEGDSMHRFDRLSMRGNEKADGRGQYEFQPLWPRRQSACRTCGDF